VFVMCERDVKVIVGIRVGRLLDCSVEECVVGEDVGPECGRGAVSNRVGVVYVG
jgi:hypothetical protein